MKRFSVMMVTMLAAGMAMAEDAKPAVAPWNTPVAAGLTLSRGNTRYILFNGSVVSE